MSVEVKKRKVLVKLLQKLAGVKRAEPSLGLLNNIFYVAVGTWLAVSFFYTTKAPLCITVLNFYCFIRSPQGVTFL